MPLSRSQLLQLVATALVMIALAGCGDAQTSADALAGDATITQLRDALRADPGNTQLRVRLARLYLAQGDGASAEAYLRRAQSTGSQDPDLDVDLARSLLLQGEHFAALELVMLMQARSEQPSALLWTLRGEAELGIVNFDAGEIRQTFINAFRALASADDPHTAQQLARLSRAEPIVNTAREHVECHDRALELIDPPQPPLSGRILQVGPTRKLTAPSRAARVAQDGDRIEIDAGVYRGDVAIWKRNDLTLIGVGGMARLEAAGRHADGKAIWVFEGDRITAQNIAFSGAKVPHRNGAGLRLHGNDAVVRNCHFHDNENGILSGNKPNNNVLIEFSTFERNGYGDGQTHNIYVGRTDRFTMRYSLSRAARVGHLVKSRARETAILFNRIIDDGGNSSYVIDLPEGGRAWIVGNELQHGQEAENPIIVSFGEERADREDQALFFVNNTIYNHVFDATVVRNATAFDATLVNNLFAGAPALFLRGPGIQSNNLRRPGPWFVDAPAHDYRLTPVAPAIDYGMDPAAIPGLQYLPDAEYRHPARGQRRLQVGAIDAGAREFCGF